MSLFSWSMLAGASVSRPNAFSGANAYDPTFTLLTGFVHRLKIQCNYASDNVIMK
jgi:hypothetical protein